MTRYQKGTVGKLIVQDWDVITSYDDTPVLRQLTRQQMSALVALSEYLGWSKRYLNPPSQDVISAFEADTRYNLMTDIAICALFIGCITNDTDVQDALNQWFLSQAGDESSDIYQTLNPSYQSNSGEGRLPAEFTRRNIAGATNPTCDLDILYAQCREVVLQTHLTIIDVLQKVEVSTNTIEVVNAVWDTLPIVGTIDDLSGIEGVIQLINYYQEAILEGYEAQFTETFGGVFDELSYGLFCFCRGDCRITIDRVLEFYRLRLAVYTAPPSLEGLVNLVETAAAINQDTTFVVDLAHFMTWGMMKVAGFFFGNYANNKFELLVRLKSDEPSNDWELLEVEFGACPAEILLTPVILDSAWGGFPIPSGYDLEPVIDEPGYWIVNSTNIATGNDWIVLQEEFGDEFSIGDLSFPDGLDSANYYGEVDGVTVSLFFSTPTHNGLTKVALNMFNGVPNARWKFKFFRPG